jgi:hypothetical protein
MIGDQRMRDRTAPAQMPQPERIVAVDQQPELPADPSHPLFTGVALSRTADRGPTRATIALPVGLAH